MTTGGVTIRVIVDEDIEQVIALWHASGVARPWNDAVRDIGFARRDPNSTVLVADLDGGIVATAMVGEDGHRGWVYYVATTPAYRGSGFGRSIMDAAERWLASQGVWKVQLLVREDNVSARRFYEHLGYGDTHAVCLQKIIEQS